MKSFSYKYVFLVILAIIFLTGVSIQNNLKQDLSKTEHKITIEPTSSPTLKPTEHQTRLSVSNTPQHYAFARIIEIAPPYTYGYEISMQSVSIVVQKQISENPSQFLVAKKPLPLTPEEEAWLADRYAFSKTNTPTFISIEDQLLIEAQTKFFSDYQNNERVMRVIDALIAEIED